jgi:pyruvate formate lyase activating enzyme
MLPVKGFIQTSFLDWPGKICSILFLSGCGFRCPACHNADLVLKPYDLPDHSLDRILTNIGKRNQWLDGITVTGGEPTINRSLPEFLRALRTTQTAVKLDTNGSNPAMLMELIRKRLVNAVYMDVKAPLHMKEYSRVAGVPVDVRLIKRSIEILRNSDIEVVFRTTAIPGLVEEPQIREIKDYLGAGRPFILQLFRNKRTLDPSFAEIPEFPAARADAMRAEFEIRPRASEILARTG